MNAPKSMKDFNTYQELALGTKIYEKSINEFIDTLEIPREENREKVRKLLCLAYAVLGMVGEAGEIAGAVSKIIRDNKGTIDSEIEKKLAKETGDVQWFTAATASEIGVPLAHIAEDNIAKLQSRKERGVLQGSGDNR